jgi:undecaprenyl phosphate-alpha-L-ara4N flippase subunit ArnE
MNAMAELWISILLGGVAQILLKRGVSGEGTKRGASPPWWLGLLRSGWIWAWLFSFLVATGLWLLAVAQLNISYAFPLLSASYVIVAVLSRIWLRENVSWQRWTAIAVISAGVLLIARA